MVKRKIFIIPSVIFIIGIIVGSFVDQNVALNFGSHSNMFARITSMFGGIFLFLGLGFMGGVLLPYTKVNAKKTGWKIFGYVISIAMLIVPCYLFGDQCADYNGLDLYGSVWIWIPFVVCSLLVIGSYFLGYKVGLKKTDDYRILPVIIALTCIAIVGYLVFAYPIKVIMTRPRPRAVVEILNTTGENIFTPWWQRFGQVNIYKTLTAGGKEDFRSFPSGHSNASAFAMIMLAALPFFFNIDKKHTTWLFYAGFIFNLFIMFIRVLANAHFISDTCMGSLLMVLAMFLVNEVYIRNTKPAAKIIS